MNNPNHINILWTGGWDSTFRILQLSHKPIAIQPYYLKDNRKCETLELQTIEHITRLIKKRNNTQCTILPLITKKVVDIEEDVEITESFLHLKASFKQLTEKKMGSQYEWLAKFSKKISNLELCIEKGSKPVEIINTFGGVQKHNDPIREEFYTIDTSNSTADLSNIFGGYHYPLLNFSKLEMKRIAEREGFIDIMNQTWFCHKPIDNKPCGKCNPCMQTIFFGLKYRFSNKALLRYQIKKMKKKLKIYFKKA